MSSNRDYFSLFNLAPSFDIDKAKLKSNYLMLQAKYHPDSEVGGNNKTSSSENAGDSMDKTSSLDKAKISAQINEGYKFLKDDLSRAEYLLKLKTGIDTSKEEGGVKPSFELLNQLLEERETIDEADTQQELEELLEKHRADFDRLTSRLRELFNQESYEAAVQPTLALKYRYKIIEDIKSKLTQITSG